MKRDENAKATIDLKLSDDHLYHVCGLATAQNMWNALVIAFHHRKMVNKLNVCRNLYFTEKKWWREAASIHQLCGQLASDVKDMDITVEDEDLAVTVVCGLPERFEHLIVAISTVASERQL